MAERFWPRVNRSGGPDACWPWLGYVATGGYGRLSRVRGSYLAHRISWEIENGPVPEGMVLDHLCRNRACVNPAHLEPVTAGENILRARMARISRQAGADFAPSWRVAASVKRAELNSQTGEGVASASGDEGSLGITAIRNVKTRRSARHARPDERPSMPDPVPTPPDQGIPARQVPYVPAPFAWDLHAVPLPDGSRAFMFILDSHSSRTITFWAEQELRAFVESAHALVSGGITLADAKDLDALKDARPFEQGG